MSVFLSPLFSGSSGNAIFAGSAKTKVLIDAGVSCRRLEQALLSIGENIKDVCAILVTHEHADHIAGISVTSRKHSIPIYATEETLSACGDRADLPSKLLRIISKSVFYIDDLLIEPFSIPHDAADPVGYCLSSGARRIAVATDLGHFSKNVERKLHGCDLVLLESNHDIQMLTNGKYPYMLKQRIRSNNGHLSNDDAGDAAIKLVNAGVTSIILGHLSKENNSEQLAYRTVTDSLLSNGITPGRDLNLGLAFRDRVTGMFHIK